jgi:hypothetical protein
LPLASTALRTLLADEIATLPRTERQRARSTDKRRAGSSLMIRPKPPAPPGRPVVFLLI